MTQGAPDAGRVLRPRSLGFVGSTEPNALSRVVLDNLARHRYEGDVWIVGSDRGGLAPSLSGRVDSVEGLPADVDALLVAVGADRAIEAVAEASRRSIPLCAVLSTDFAEGGRTDRLDALRDAAGPSMVLLGPGSMGFVDVAGKVAASWSGSLRLPELVAGGVALVSESGGLGGCVLERAQEDGIGVSHCVWTGAGATHPATRMGAILAQLPEVEAIALLMESAPSAEALAEVASAGRERGIPVCLTKIGRTSEAARVVAAHSGSLMGDYQALRAVCRREGIVICDDLLDLLPMAVSCSRGVRRSSTRKAFVMSGSGGANVVLTDALVEAGWELPAPAPELAARLRDLVPVRATVANPLDLTAGYDDDVAAEVRHSVQSSGSYDVLVESITMVTGERAVARAKSMVRDDGPAPLMVYWPVGALAQEARRVLIGSGIYPFASATALTAAMGERVRSSGTRGEPEPPLATGVPVDASQTPPEVLVEHLLARAGARRPASRRAGSMADAVAAADGIGWPVVLKVTGHAHKSDVGGVVLDVRTPVELERAWPELEALSTEGIDVEQQADPEVELYLGWRRVPELGPILLVGFGGTTVEVAPDVAEIACPATPEEIAGALRSLRGSALLGEHRGRGEIDLSELAGMASRLSVLALEMSDVHLLELNPVALAADGSTLVLDALVETYVPDPVDTPGAP